MTVLSVVQEVQMFGLGVLTDVVTENPSRIAGSSVRFELYCGGNGKPRAYYVKMLVMTFRSACVKSYNPTYHYGFLACDGLDEDVWLGKRLRPNVGQQ